MHLVALIVFVCLYGPVKGKVVKAYQCFGDDTRVLTDAGFLFLDQIQERIQEGHEVLYACYDKTKKQLVYGPGTLVLNESDPNGCLLNFTQAHEQKSWNSDSHGYGREEPDGSRSNHLSIRVTPDHDMFVQTGNKDVNGHIAWKLKAGRMAEPTKVKAATLFQEANQARKCVRFYALASEGVDLDARIYDEQGQALTSIVDDGNPQLNDELNEHLGLKGQDQLNAFLELYGFWLGDGTLSYGAARRFANTVRFSQRKPGDKEWLASQIPKCGVTATVSESSTDGRTVFDVSDARWFQYFDQEYGSKYRPSQYFVEDFPTTSSARSNNDGEASIPMEVQETPMSELECPKVSPSVEQPHTVRREILKSAKWLYPWVLRRCNKSQLQLIIRGLHRADGHWGSGVTDTTGNVKNKVIFTSSAAFRDQLIHVMMHAGYTAFFHCNYRKGTVRGYTKIGEPGARVYRPNEVIGLEQQFRPIKATADNWGVCWSAYDSHPSGVACYPNMHSSDIKMEPYTKPTWCVKVAHPDHLIVAQRAHLTLQSDGTRLVTKASRPIIIGQCSEDPWTVLKHNLPVDVKWYMEKQLKKPVEHVMLHVIGAAACKNLWVGDHVRKVYKPTPVADEKNKNGILGMGSIARFIKATQQCSNKTCRAPLRSDDERNRGLCKFCQPEVATIRAKLTDELTVAEDKCRIQWETCRKCQRNNMLLARACTTITCPTLSKRIRADEASGKLRKSLREIANDW